METLIVAMLVVNALLLAFHWHLCRTTERHVASCESGAMHSMSLAEKSEEYMRTAYQIAGDVQTMHNGILQAINSIDDDKPEDSDDDTPNWRQSLN